MKSIFRMSRRSSVVTVFAIVTLLSLTVSIETAQAATQFRLVKTIISPNPSGGGFFGQSLAVAGDRFLVGSRDCNDTVCGAVHLFDSDGNLVRSIFAPTPEGFSGFGDSVGAMGGYLLVGATLDDTAGPDAGAAYLFDGATGDLLQTFLNPNPDPGAPFSRDFFGNSVTGFGDDVLVSAPDEDIAGDDAGAVYLLTEPPASSSGHSLAPPQIPSTSSARPSPPSGTTSPSPQDWTIPRSRMEVLYTFSMEIGT